MNWFIYQKPYHERAQGDIDLLFHGLWETNMRLATACLHCPRQNLIQALITSTYLLCPAYSLCDIVRNMKRAGVMQ